MERLNGAWQLWGKIGVARHLFVRSGRPYRSEPKGERYFQQAHRALEAVHRLDLLQHFRPRRDGRGTDEEVVADSAADGGVPTLERAERRGAAVTSDLLVAKAFTCRARSVMFS